MRETKRGDFRSQLGDDSSSATKKKLLSSAVAWPNRGAVSVGNGAKVHLGTAYWGCPLCRLIGSERQLHPQLKEFDILREGGLETCISRK